LTVAGFAMRNSRCLKKKSGFPPLELWRQ